jgi:hypothetical protein
VDLTAAKRFSLGNASLELRADFFNLLNTPVFQAPERSLTSSTFGQIRSSQLEREIQLGLRLLF